MSNIASVRKEVRMLERVLAPKEEPEWAKNAREIDKSLREYAAIKEGSGFNSLSPAEQVECELNLGREVVENMKRQGYWAEAERNV